jgi:cellulose synthase operon protein C
MGISRRSCAVLVVLCTLAAAPAFADTGAKLAKADAQMARGKYAEAEKAYAAIHAADPSSHRAIVGLGRAKQAQGEDATDTYHLLYDAYDAKDAPLDDAAFLTSVAIAAAETGDWQNANVAFQDATERDPTNAEAWLLWAELFERSGSFGEASVNYERVLALDPSNPTAHAGVARIAFDVSGELATAEAHVAKALERDPAHVAALLVRARILLERDDHAGAMKVLAKAEKVNARNVEVLAVRAASYYVTDANAKYKATRKKAVAINPRGGAFYELLAEIVVRHHRYREAATLCEEGLALAPEHFGLGQRLGYLYLHLVGDAPDGVSYEQKGRDVLAKAWKRNKYDVRTYNLLGFYDAMGTVYTTFDAGPLRFRMPKEDEAIVRAYVAPWLLTSYEAMAERYRVRPPLVQIDLLADEEAFSLRTVGMPDLGANAVAFGPLITTVTPRREQSNWAMNLHHELAHVFQDELSRSHVPRWFTEGLAVYEEARGHDGWITRDDEMRGAIANDRVLPFAELDTGFAFAPDLDHLLAAYAQAWLVIEYVVERDGFDAVISMLKAYRKGKSTAAALKAATRLTPAKLDRAFAAWLAKRYAKPPPDRVFWPHDIDGIARLLELAHQDGRDADVRTYAAAAIFVAPMRPRVHLWYAEALAQGGDADRARSEGQLALDLAAKDATLTADEIAKARALAK